MCGIAGLWNFSNEKLSKEKLLKFNNAMIHRGPDGYGYYIDEKADIGLGHRRLSILDLSENGKQPMSFANGRYWITYNGEVFNFIEIRKELEAKGYSFVSDSDTEVILGAYHCWGKECFFKFNGMWAIAIWDEQEQKLFLCRDRFGVKPLHYLYVPGNFFAFASETLAFKQIDGYKREFDQNNLSRTIQYAASIEGYGYTIFKDIYQLMPGHYIELKKDERPKQKRWWDTRKNLSLNIPIKYEEQVEAFREIFLDSCRIRMRSDVTIASALSGGVDSSSVYCMLHHLMGQQGSSERIAKDWQQAFIATFPGTSVDERQFAEQVIKFTNGKANYISQNFHNLPQEILDTTIKFDAISPTPIIAVSDVYKAMNQQNIKVSMDGHGVDEMLFGYISLAGAAYVESLLNKDEPFSNDLSDIYAFMHPENFQSRMKEELKTGGTNRKEQYLRFKDGRLKTSMKKVFRQIMPKSQYINGYFGDEWLKQKTIASLANISDNPYSLAELSYSELLLFEEFHLTTLPFNLRDFDRASMQSSIEIRMPFMDWRLVSFVFSLPLKSKIGHGYTKRILRDSMKGIMPESIRTRKLKIGLGAPTTEWFNGPLKQFIQDMVNSKAFLKSDIWEGGKIRDFTECAFKNNLWDKHNGQRLWSYLNAMILIDNNS